VEEVKRRLQKEVSELHRELRVTLPQEIKKALAMGDLRENAEYHAALERQSYVKARIAHLQKRLSGLSMVRMNQIPRDRIAFGSTVILEDLDTEEQVTWELVMNDEANSSEGRISVTSPIGRGLVGRREGDEVDITTPAGKRSFEVVEVQTLHDKATPASED
jgi:transcription elongation factor GreA